MASQENREGVVPINPNAGTMTSRVREFTWMNPRIFYGAKVDKVPQELSMRFTKC